jgi:hypothetical protein
MLLPEETGGSRGCSSAGRAAALQAAGRRFEPDQLHHQFAGRNPDRVPPEPPPHPRDSEGKKQIDL